MTLSKLNSFFIDPKTIEITYEVGGFQPLHPDWEVALRFEEYAISDCEYGCKIYADPRSNVKVLYHNSSYGCRK